MTTATTPPGLVDVTIDGHSVRVPAGTSVFDAARMNGINIPTLCHLQNQTPVGVCRLCVVDTGARVLTASCVRPVEPGLNVVTNSEKVLGARKTLLELMMADHPSPCTRQLNSGDCELETLASAAGASLASVSSSQSPEFNWRVQGEGWSAIINSSSVLRAPKTFSELVTTFKPGSTGRTQDAVRTRAPVSTTQRRQTPTGV